MQCQLSPPPNLCYDGKNVSLLVVNRDIQCVHTNAEDTHNVTDDNRKSCVINRDKTENITFQAKGFLVNGPYENCISKHMRPSDFLNPLKHIKPSRKLKKEHNKRLAVVQAIFFNKDDYSYPVDFKRRQKKNLKTQSRR